jgi:predicted dehydrogenase|eukprot:scaffold18768_cov80-Cyclotella_meneghiniana.AAC.3
MVEVAKPTSNQAEVILVGCGMPLRGMGWYHAVQMLGGECPSAKLCHIVEPWFLGAGASGPGGAEFAEFKNTTAETHGVQFHSSVADLPPVADGVKRLALISGRTADNPRLLNEVIAAGCGVVYLEKPGAPTVAELKSMKETAANANVSICMGYNKNVCKYVRNAREFAANVDGSHVTFVSNNTYENNAASLGECFERNAEGMLKNMAIHELALLASFYDVTVDNIDSVGVDEIFSSCQTLKGPSGKEFTDFDRVKFTIKTKTGKEVSVQADRCGGDVSYALVTDADGNELFRHSMPDEDDKANVAVLEAKYPGAMPYFFSQDPDYVTVKERVAKHALTGEEAIDIATIDIAIAALSVAEYLTPLMKEKLSNELKATSLPSPTSVENFERLVQ